MILINESRVADWAFRLFIFVKVVQMSVRKVRGLSFIIIEVAIESVESRVVLFYSCVSSDGN